MPRFEFTIRIQDVDEKTSKIFQEFANQIQQTMQSHSENLKRTNAKLEEQTREAQILNDELRKLTEENERLKMQSQVPAMRAAPPSVPLPSQQRAGVMGKAGKFTFKKEIHAHDKPVHSVAVEGKNTDRFCSASWDGTVKIHKLSSDEVVTLADKERGAEPAGLYAVAFAKQEPDLIGCASSNFKVYVWNLNKREKKHALGGYKNQKGEDVGHTNEVNGIDFHHEQTVMCSTSDDKTAVIWDYNEGIVLRTLDKHNDCVYGCTFLGQNHQFCVATCCFDKVVRVFDMRDKKTTMELKDAHTDDIIGIHFPASDKQLLATGSDDGMVKLWDTRKNLAKVHEFNTKTLLNDENNEVKRVRYSPDGRYLGAGCSSGKVLIFNTTDMSLYDTLEGHTDCVFDIAWGVEQKGTGSTYLVSASHDNSIRRWSLM